MRKFAILLSALISLLLSFNAFALEIEYNNPNNPNEPTVYASTPAKDSNYSYGYRWTWLHNDLCVQFQASELRTAKVRRDILQDRHDVGLMTRWCENNQLKNRETYSGKWSQSEDGIWSFQFDDYTIPVDITKIDGVLYAFNGYGISTHSAREDGDSNTTQKNQQFFITFPQSNHIIPPQITANLPCTHPKPFSLCSFSGANPPVNSCLLLVRTKLFETSLPPAARSEYQRLFHFNPFTHPNMFNLCSVFISQVVKSKAVRLLINDICQYGF